MSISIQKIAFFVRVELLLYSLKKWIWKNSFLWAHKDVKLVEIAGFGI